MDGIDVAPLELPAHSPLGASSAERWLNCPGSVTLIDLLRSSPGYVEEDPDYRRDGTEAHALAAYCLETDIDAWEASAEEQFPALTADMMDAVQVYLDFVRSIPGIRRIEWRVHRPELHPLFYGTLDCVIFEGVGVIHVIDYKHGVGVVVDAEENPQLKYYGYGVVGDDGLGKWKPDTPVKLTIVQPRGYHPDGDIRTWETTVGEIRRWAEEELRPAMEATKDLDYLALGEWCRFCPAKLVCPAFDNLGRKALAGTEITYAEAQQLKMLVKAIEERDFRRLMEGADPQEVGAKLVAKRADRIWKDAAPIEQKFGDDAWQPKALRSPAQIEKLPGGKDFVAEYAYKPATGYSVATLDDKRMAVKPQTPEEKYGDPSKYL